MKTREVSRLNHYQRELMNIWNENQTGETITGYYKTSEGFNEYIGKTVLMADYIEPTTEVREFSEFIEGSQCMECNPSGGKGSPIISHTHLVMVKDPRKIKYHV